MNSGRSELVGDSYTYSSSYDYGEGWTTGDIANGASTTYLLQVVYRSIQGQGRLQPVVKVNAAGNAVHTAIFTDKT